ncbi:MAG: L-ribulose-5-phosphate 4-epimerase [Alkalibacterium sp.]|nr:L-ribulose-5-phosphate 4-epimerase [Alkalibacterium sp.]
MLENLKKKVYDANMALPQHNLVVFTWGNVSGIDREKGLVVIKPSGVDYSALSPNNMVVVDLNGEIVEGDYKPSSDTATHIELYKFFKDIGGVVHTHSPWAVSFAQAGMDIPAAGTTHADYFYGDIPVTRKMRTKEIESDYEKNTGTVIVDTFKERSIDPNQIPGVLVNDHGPLTWGTSPDNAVYNSVVLEKVAEMTYHGLQISSSSSRMDQALLDKHYLRKHGKNAYYGQ